MYISKRKNVSCHLSIFFLLVGGYCLDQPASLVDKLNLLPFAMINQFYKFCFFQNHSRPDLIVGAPFYYDREAGGAVYVYSNPHDGGLTATTPYVKLLGKPESR